MTRAILAQHSLAAATDPAATAEAACGGAGRADAGMPGVMVSS
jgi:hypothetical protein